MEYVIEPLEGAGPLKLGMSRDAVQDALVEAPQDDAGEDDEDESRDSFYDGALRVTYDAEDRVAAIELAAGGEIRALYRDLDLFEVTSTKAVAALEKDGAHDPDGPEMPYTFVFPALELSLERSDDADDSAFERIILGGEGYYSQREVDPEAFGFEGGDRRSDEDWDDENVDEEEELEEEGFSTSDGEDEEDEEQRPRASSLFSAGFDDDDDEEFDDLGEQELDFDNSEGIDWSDDDDDWLADDEED
ncbi:MAG: hypothetical protein AAF449_02625 [Myxococcota bacterium]